MYDEDIEKTVLYYIIFEKQNYLLLEDDFVVERNKSIVKAINLLREKNEEISMINIAEKFKTYKKDVLKYLSELGEYSFGISSDEAYNKLIDYSKKRKVYELMRRENEEENTDIFIEKMIKELTEIQNRNEKEKKFSDQVIETVQEIENNYKKRNDRSLYTGIIGLDDKILGLHNKELTILGARPRSWKNNISVANSTKHC